MPLPRPSDSVPTEHSAGGLVFQRTPNGLVVLLILDGHGNWGFPKGHLEDDEKSVEAAKREIAEETGIGDLGLISALDTIDWYFRKHGKPARKICDLYLFETSGGTPTPQAAEGISRAEWVPVELALKKLTHENTRSVMRQGCDAFAEQRAEKCQ
jgi:8-oxo-dGTP pyrophosphatase MutT (NUDIX family)